MSTLEQRVKVYLTKIGILNSTNDKHTIFFRSDDMKNYDQPHELDLVQLICDYYNTDWQEPALETLPSTTTRVYISYDGKQNPELSEMKGEVITGTYYVSGPGEQRTGFYYIDPWTLEEKQFPNTVVYFAPTP